LHVAGALCAGHRRRENGVAVLPPGKSGGLFFLPPAELARHFFQQQSFGRCEASQPVL